MSTIVLSNKAAKLMKLCDAEGFKSLDDLLAVSVSDSLCPAICMTEGCDYTTDMEPDRREGYCEACGGNTVTSALVLAGLIYRAGMMFRNYYLCARCCGEWTDVWSAQCDDDCPHCGARHMSPYKSEDVEEGDDE